jgi:hypothetical protein
MTESEWVDQLDRIRRRFDSAANAARSASHPYRAQLLSEVKRLTRLMELAVTEIGHVRNGTRGWQKELAEAAQIRRTAGSRDVFFDQEPIE